MYLHFQPNLQGTVSSRAIICVQYKILSLKKLGNSMYFLISSSFLLLTNFPNSVFLFTKTVVYS